MTMPDPVILIGPRTDADRALVGGKAASLFKLHELGATVPEAAVLTTEAYHSWEQGGDTAIVRNWVRQAIALLEAATGRSFGERAGGLIVSVRSGAPVSMPGMMDTVLNVGIDLDAGAPRHILNSRYRFAAQFAETVLELSEDDVRQLEADLPFDGTAASVDMFEKALRTRVSNKGGEWPAGIEEELVAAVEAVFRSWNSSRARLYRKMRRIDDSLGTAVTIQRMVFGNCDASSGSGVAFTRNPSNGASGLMGEFMAGGQGEEVVSGRETAQPLEDWRLASPTAFEELAALGQELERRSGEVHEIEFTMEKGRLYILQCRPALLTAAAAAAVAVSMADEGLLTREQAVAYATRHGFESGAAAQRFSIRDGAVPAGRGLAVGGGVVSGRLALSETRAAEFTQAGEAVIFATRETSPRLLPIMSRSAGLLTMHGGATSHAAVVAREMGIPAIVGAGGYIDGDLLALRLELREGEIITLDADQGAVYSGDVRNSEGNAPQSTRILAAWERGEA
ncbi:MAG: PEP/pyruvate-binding domain-containing protein [Sphingopyxis granuli]